MKKFLYYENGLLEIWTEEDCHKYFENCPGLIEQKLEGTTFTTWMHEMIKMQIFVQCY